MVIPIAIREGWDIRCELPITEMFLHNIEEFLIPAITKGDARAKEFKIHAKTLKEPLQSAGAVATAVTCGVDSTYTIKRYTQDKYEKMKLTHLVVGSLSLDLWDIKDTKDLYEWEEKYGSRFARYKVAAEYTELPLIKIFTNFVDFITKRNENNPTYAHIRTHVYITMGAILCLEKLISIYLFAGSYPLNDFSLKDNLMTDAAHYDLLTTSVLNHPGFMCFSGGGSITRIEKLLELTTYPLAKKILHPCFKNTKRNCSQPGCSKCMRDLFTLDCYDKLDELSEVYDIQHYKDNLSEYLYAAMKFKENPFFVENLEMLARKYPKQLEEAQKKYEKDKAPVAKETFNELTKAYDTMILMVSNKNPGATLCKWFEEKGIKKLYFTGESKFGNQIKGLIQDNIEIVTYKTGDVNDCHAVFIAPVSKSGINKSRKAILEKLNSEKDIYTIDNVVAVFKKENK